MYQILKFISNNKTLLLFLVLEFVAITLVINTHAFHQSKFMWLSQNLSGRVQKTSSNINRYFELSSINESLTKENTYLKNELERLNANVNTTTNIDSIDASHKFIAAKIYKNSFLKRNNYLTINKGSKDGVETDMGVVSNQGIVGIVIQTSAHFSKVLSLLNSHSSYNVKLSKTNHFGSLQWDGKNFKVAQLYDIPLQANVKVGDTVKSGSFSLYFVENTPIGTVTEVEISNKMYEVINVELFEDFSSLSDVYVVNNKYLKEVKTLENTAFE